MDGLPETSAFAANYKKKSSTIDKRTLRAHRRSIEWKKLREDSYSKGRDLQSCSSADSDTNLSVVEEGNESPNRKLSIHGKNINKKSKSLKEQEPNKPDGQSRREMLIKWKAERDLKKNLAAKEKKPAFKVVQVKHTDVESLKKNKKSEVVKPVPQPTAVTKTSRPLRSKENDKPAIEGRVTRSRGPTTRPTTKAPPPVSKPLNAGRGTRAAAKSQTAPAPKPEPVSKPISRKQSATQNKAVSKSTRAYQKQSAPVKQTLNTRGATKRSTRSSVRDQSREDLCDAGSDRIASRNEQNRWITCDRNTNVDIPSSFAPNDFTFDFSAPNQLGSFTFTPLSPSSAASFLGGTSSCGTSVGRTSSTPKGNKISGVALANPVVTESEESQSDSKSDSDGGKSSPQQGPRRGRSRSSMSLKRENKSDGSDDATAGTASRNTDQPLSMDVDYATIETVEEDTLPQTHKAQENIQGCTGSSNSMPVCLAEDDPVLPTVTEEDMAVDEEAAASKTPDASEPHAEQDKENANTRPSLIDAVFATPGSVKGSCRKRRARSMSRLGHSARGTPRMNRSSLALRALSPEEAVEILMSSPMVEMRRDTPKSHHSSSCIDDEADAELLAQGEALLFADIPPQPVFTDSAPDSLPTVSVADSLPAGSVPDPLYTGSAPDPLSTGSVPDPPSTDSALDSLPKNSTPPDSTSSDPVSQPPEQISASPGLNPPGVSLPSATPASQDSSPEPVHDVTYFRNLMKSETDHLTSLGDKWNVINENLDLSEDVRGQIRTTVGQANLLMAQRFKQFTGLVDNCEFKTGEKETTCTDLQGFWDMVYFQVEDVNNKFESLDALKAANWVTKTDPAKKAAVKKVTVSKPVVKAKKNVKSKFAAFKAKLKAQTESDVPPEAPAEMKTFDAGLFVITSPVKTPSPHCELSRSGLGSTIKRAAPRQRSVSGSPWLKTVLNQSLRRSLNLGVSPMVTGSAEFKERVAVASLNDTPKRTTRRSTRLSTQAMNTSATENSFSKYLAPSVPEDVVSGSTEASPASMIANLSLDTPRAGRRGKSRAASLLFTPDKSSPAKRQKTMADEDNLICFSPV